MEVLEQFRGFKKKLRPVNTGHRLRRVRRVRIAHGVQFSLGQKKKNSLGTVSKEAGLCIAVRRVVP